MILCEKILGLRAIAGSQRFMTDPGGTDSATLAKNLHLAKDVVERHLLYCADYALVAWNRHVKGAGRAMITIRGRDYLARQRL